MYKIILGILFIVVLGWCKTNPDDKSARLQKSLNSGVSMWKFEKNIKLCKSDGASKCYQLGQMYETGKNGVNQDEFKAKIFYFNACAKSFHDACNKHGHTSKNLKQNYSDDKIFQHYKQLCTASNGSVCCDIGVMYASGNGLKQDQVKARKFYEKSCNGNYAQGCRNLAYQYKRARGGKRDYKKAKILFKKACDRGDNIGCGQYIRMQKRR